MGKERGENGEGKGGKEAKREERGVKRMVTNHKGENVVGKDYKTKEKGRDPESRGTGRGVVGHTPRQEWGVEGIFPVVPTLDLNDPGGVRNKNKRLPD